MWPFQNKIIGQPVHINCEQQTAKFRKTRAETRIDNLTNKLARMQSRPTSFPGMSQEIANTRVAVQKWRDLLELAELEISQQERGPVQ